MLLSILILLVCVVLAVAVTRLIFYRTLNGPQPVNDYHVGSIVFLSVLFWMISTTYIHVGGV